MGTLFILDWQQSVFYDTVILSIEGVLCEIYPGHVVDPAALDLRKGLGGLDVRFSS